MTKKLKDEYKINVWSLINDINLKISSISCNNTVTDEEDNLCRELWDANYGYMVENLNKVDACFINASNSFDFAIDGRVQTLRLKDNLALPSPKNFYKVILHGDINSKSYKEYKSAFHKKNNELIFLKDFVDYLETLKGNPTLLRDIDEKYKSIMDDFHSHINSDEIKNSGLPRRIKSVLWANSINSFDDLADLSDNELMSMDNFGRKSLSELKKYMKKNNIPIK